MRLLTIAALLFFLPLQSRIKAINGKIEWKFCEENGVSAYLEFETANLQKEVFV